MTAPAVLPHRSPVPARPGAGVPQPTRPSLPALPEAVQRAVRASRSWCVTDDKHGFLGVREAWAVPAVAPADLPDIRQQLLALEPQCAPAEREWLLARVLALLSHYRAEALPPQVERMVAEDWAEDLGEYPAWAIDEAARQWRRTKKFRPSISEIRALCAEAVEPFVTLRDRLRAVLDAHARAVQAANPQVRRLNALAGAAIRHLPS